MSSAESAAISQACPAARVFSEPKINQVANELTASGRVAEAIRVLEANTELFPRSFLAPYWLAETAPDLIGGTIVVDAGPALSDTDPATARALRNMWAHADFSSLLQRASTTAKSKLIRT